MTAEMAFVADVIKSVEQESIEKEKNMNKEYIVIHDNFGGGAIRVGIVFKSKIVRVIKDADGKAIILLDTGYNQYCTETYEDIVKQLV